MKELLVALLFVVALIPGRATEQPLHPGVTAELIGTYDQTRINEILTTELKEFSDFPVTYPQAQNAVRLYRITYPSVIPEQQNRPTIASGLLAIPDTGKSSYPVVSYQHGTVFTKTAVPSHPEESMETRLIVANFAAQGYIVIGADYFGKGLSKETDSYLVKRSTRQACLDHLRAAQAVCAGMKITWDELFVSGWSQGGWATFNFLHELESVGITVTAAAAASAPVDPYIAVSGWLHVPTEHDAVYLPAAISLMINSYATYYQFPGLVEEAIRPEYQQASRDLYLNQITYAEAAPKLPEKVIDLLREEFVAAGKTAHTPYWQILQQNQTYRWQSATPLRAYYGGADEVTSRYLGTIAPGYQQAVGGAETVAIDAGEKADHRGVFLFGIANQKPWFDSLLEKK